MSGDRAQAARAAQLLDEGARLLAAAWDDTAGMVRRETAAGVLHDARATVAYAGVLLRAGAPEDVARAERALRSVLSMQERREQDPHCGNFRWSFEDACVVDLNAVEFVLDGLIPILRDHAAALAPETAAAVRHAVALGLDEIDRLDVHPSYTNIFLSDVCNSVLGGEALGDAGWVERGARRLDEWLEFTNSSGAPHEFNSPTYCAVDLLRLAELAEHTRDETIALKARLAEERLWLHVAAHYHPALAQLAGPHARSYRDGWTGAPGYLKLLLWHLLGDGTLRRETPFFPGGREEGHTGIAAASPHCPPEAAGWLREKRYPFETRETSDAEAGLDLSTYMTAGYALGTASRAYAAGDPPEPSAQFNSALLYFRRDAAPGYGVLFARYLLDDAAPGAAGDLWDQGRFVAAQHRNRAIVAYGLTPRLRPFESARLSVRMLGLSTPAQVWAGARRVERFPARVEPGEPVVVAEGDVYVAVVPLEPSAMGADAGIELTLADGQLALDVYNYRGPAKSFWEHRSQAGPFYKGTVRNAFILEVAGRDEFPDADAFRRHVAAARIADSVDETYAREIAYASDGGALSLRYSLWDMSLIERRYDGVTYAPPLARAGALDGEGPQWLQTRDSLVELAGARLMAGRAPKWLFVDPAAGRYVFVNPSDEVAPLWLETARTVVECDAFGFGRVSLDEAAAVIEVEAAGEIGPLRLRGAPSLHLALNGRDVTDLLTPPDAAGVREFAGIDE